MGGFHLGSKSRISKDLSFIETLINDRSLDILDLCSMPPFHLGGLKVVVGVRLSYLTSGPQYLVVHFSICFLMWSVPCMPSIPCKRFLMLK